MKTFFCKNFKFSLVLLVIILVSISTSCNKDDSKNLDKNENNKQNTDEQNNDETEDNNKGSIYSLFLDNEGKNNYISLNSKGLVKIDDNWDFEMTRIYASSIHPNPSLNARVNFIDVEYDDVNAEKILEKFGSDKENFNKNFKNLNYFGMHKFNGNQEGWANYTMSTHLVVPLSNRTILLITADTNDTGKHKLLKLKITSMYKGNILNPTPADTYNVPYLSCKFEKININIDDLITD